VALKKRLRTEASLRPILAQYVPLELNTAEPEFSAWSRKFPSEGNGIPKVYVVRADGEVLYGKSGTPDELPKFLVAYRKQAGAILTAKQMKDLTAGLEKAKKAQADGDMATAMKEIGKFAAVNSYAAVVMEGKELATKMLEEAKEELKKAEEQLATSDEALTGAVALLRVIRVYQPFKDVVKSAGQTRAKFQKEKRDVLTLAEQLDAAAKLEDTKAFDRATKAYQGIIQRNPDSPAAKLAQERLEAVEAAKNGEPPKKSGAKEAKEPAEKAFKLGQ
jgi:hypothetical protein